MAQYPDPSFTTLQGFFQYGNTLTGDMAGNIIVIILWVVFFLLGKSYSNRTAIVGASFVMTIVSFLLAMNGIVSPIMITLFLVATAIGLLLG